MHHKINMNGDRKWPSWGAIVFVAFVAAFIALAISARCTIDGDPFTQVVDASGWS